MKRDCLTGRNYACLQILICISTVAITGAPNSSRQSIWISVLASLAPAVLLMLLYARLHVLSPGKNLYDMSLDLYGSILGRIIIIIFLLYCMDVCCSSIFNYGNFMRINSLYTTPSVFIGTAFVLPALLLAKKKASAFGNWGFLAFAFVGATMLLLYALSISQLQPQNLRPVGDLTLDELLTDAARTLIYPVGEAAIMLGILDLLDDQDKPLRTFIVPTLIVYALVILLYVTSIGVLGFYMQELVLFPSYKAMATIQVGFLERVEIFLGTTFVLSAITKIACCLLAVSKGLSRF